MVVKVKDFHAYPPPTKGVRKFPKSKVRHIADPHFYTKSQVVSTPFKYQSTRTETTFFGVTQSVLADVSGTSEFKVNTFTGQTNPQWKAQIARGENATTPASGVKYDITSPWVTAEAEWWNGIDGVSSRVDRDEAFGYLPQFWPTLGSPTQSDIADATNRAIRRFIEKANAVRSSVEAGQDFGEYHQTVRSFVRPCESLRQHVLSYFPLLKKVKARYKGVKALRKALTDTYLEWTFGWNPLVSDIADAYVGLTNKGFDLTPISSGAKVIYDGLTNRTLNDVGSGLFYIRGDTRIVSEYSVRMKGMIKSGRINGSLPVLQSLQLTPEFWLPTAWDLLPYSFIADYFTNIGDIIRAACFVTSSLSWGVKTVRNVTNSVTSYSFQPTQFTGVYNTQFCLASNPKSSIVSFQRGAIGESDLIPTFRFSLPVSFKPFENIAALMSSNGKGLVPFF